MISAPLDTPLFEGNTLTASVPRPFQVAVNGRPYLLNFQFEPFRREAFRHKSLPLLRNQADPGGGGVSTINNLPAEASLNPDGLWRRSQDNFWLGAGQSYLDRRDSNPDAYHASKGVNPWAHWQLTLLNDTHRILSTPDSLPLVLAVGTHIYLAYNGTVSFTSTITGTPALTNVFSTGGSPISSICTDGHNVWFAAGSQGVYTTTEASTSMATQYVTSGLSSTAVVAYVKGRLMVANNNSVYNVTGSGALPAALFTQANTAFQWVAFADGQNQIYMAGYAGANSIIYGTTVVAEGTTLGAPTVYGELPTGETVTALYGYLGFLLIGSSLGIRLATPDSTGVLTLGALILIPSPVQCFSAYNRWVWFGWSNYDTSSTGLGRVDLSHFTQPSTPAFASDLMASGNGTVTSVTVFGGQVIFGVAGAGFYAQTATYVPSGTFDSGLITYDVADLKVAVYLDLQFAPPTDSTSISCAVANDGGPFQRAGAVSAASDTGRQSFATDQSPASTFEVELTLSTTNTANTPILYRHTLRSLIAAPSVTEFIVPVLLQSTVNPGDANMVAQSPSGERAYLESLRQQRKVVSYQEGASTYQVTIEALDWLPDHPDGPTNFADFDGTLVLTLHSL